MSASTSVRYSPPSFPSSRRSSPRDRSPPLQSSPGDSAASRQKRRRPRRKGRATGEPDRPRRFHLHFRPRSSRPSSPRCRRHPPNRCRRSVRGLDHRHHLPLHRRKQRQLRKTRARGNRASRVHERIGGSQGKERSRCEQTSPSECHDSPLERRWRKSPPKGKIPFQRELGRRPGASSRDRGPSPYGTSRLTKS